MTYVKEAVSTLSNAWHGELVPRPHLRLALSTAAAALRKLDHYKKALFYGRPIPGQVGKAADVIVPNSQGVPHSVCRFGPEGRQPNADAKAADIIHAIIGMATEAGELLEALLVAMDDGRLDYVNLAEECGDVFWYQAVLAHSIGMSFDEMQAQNIAKLRKRFPNKFTEVDAVNRDLVVERATLEAHQAAADNGYTKTAVSWDDPKPNAAWWMDKD